MAKAKTPVEGLEPAERKGIIGAFLTGSYKESEYVTTVEPRTTKKATAFTLVPPVESKSPAESK